MQDYHDIASRIHTDINHGLAGLTDGCGHGDTIPGGGHRHTCKSELTMQTAVPWIGQRDTPVQWHARDGKDHRLARLQGRDGLLGWSDIVLRRIRQQDLDQIPDTFRQMFIRQQFADLVHRLLRAMFVTTAAENPR